MVVWNVEIRQDGKRDVIEGLDAKTGTHLTQESAKSRLLSVVQQLCESYNLVSKGQLRTQAALSMLTTVCERSITYDFSHPNRQYNTRFDPYFTAKSDLASTYICSTVLEYARSAGYSAGAAMESADSFGHYDITITKGNPCVVLRRGTTVCRLEIKASFGLPLSSQVLTRYMFGQGPLVLCRIMTGQVAVLDPLELEGFVDFSAELLSSRGDRVLHGTGFTVPGPHCKSCGDLDCPFNERNSSGSQRVVTVREADFQHDIVTFARNLPLVSRRAGEVVIDLVKRAPELPP